VWGVERVNFEEKIKKAHSALKRIKKVCVLGGGESSERPISLKTSEAVMKALRNLGFKVEFADFSSQNDEWKKLVRTSDVVFNCLHGGDGENGKVQAWLEIEGIPFTASGYYASYLAMDKPLLKKYIASLKGLKVTKILPDKVFWLSGFEDEESVFSEVLDIEKKWGRAVLKPADEGSSVGLFVSPLEKYQKEIINMLREGKKLMVEPFVKGVDFTVGYVAGLLPPIRIECGKDNVFDWDAKYVKSSTIYKVLDYKGYEELLEDIELMIKAFKFKSAFRVDYRFNPEAGEYYLLEINTVPGMTERSLIPKAAYKLGLSFEDVVGLILWEAISFKATGQNT